MKQCQGRGIDCNQIIILLYHSELLFSYLGPLLFLQKAVHFLISTHEQHVLSVEPNIERSTQSTNSPEIGIIKMGH
jgi:hypothetical protein